MRIHLMTRGLTDDYRFLGDAPAEQRWTAFGRLTSFDHRSLLLRGGPDGWWLYLSAIPSVRRDRTDTVIRYTTVLTGAASEDTSRVAGLVREWLSQGETPAEPGVLSGLLDEQFPADVVERLLRPGDAAAETAAEVARRFAAVLDKLDTDDAEPGDSADRNVSWLGEARSDRAVDRLVRRAAALLGGAEGWALVLNLANEEDARAWLADQPGGEHAVLVTDRLRSEVVEIDPKGLADVAPRRRGHRSPLWWAAVLGGATVALAGLVLLIIWVVTRGTR
ncbi:hypothetical protein [Cryptosporangium aurantiacum]|uniref:Uncharacterized protein n=1 Tax=Cryptosporangium aurantiacum TaxID=134849 RepID=A0A1M7I9K9_9ACTN|nr:hypothetical protein [Cryptosporangium aurantiacum]SHM37288.1 hypothetical protein SAMN05443668_101431 [Cryptosporangium aurantiacum]